MTRKNIFEILEEKYDINLELYRISQLFSSFLINYKFVIGFREVKNENYTIEYLVSKIFYDWKSRGSCISCRDMREHLNIDEIEIKKIKDFNEILLCLEYYINIQNLFLNKVIPDLSNEYRIDSNFQLLQENINILLDHINYKKVIFEKEEKVILVPKDPAATAVAEISSDDVAFAIMKYHHASLKGNLNEKKRLLLSIAHEYEPLLEKPVDGFTKYFDDANNMLNNAHIRHNNKSGRDRKEMIANMSDEELEHWYDELYQLLLFCVLAQDNKERKEKIHAFLAEINAKPDKKQGTA